uniref:C-opsin n=1 Tax=Euperipatoides kanangrensis TaxID=488523 RepID=T2I572_9BILA|nr:c-opsin [Euperipatoides kanangrensis]
MDFFIFTYWLKISKRFSYIMSNFTIIVSYNMNLLEYSANNDSPIIRIIPFKQGLTEAGFIGAAVVLFLIGFFGFFHNLFVIMLVVKNKSLQTPMNFLLMNQSVSDMLVSLFGNPFTFISAVFRRWLFGPWGCVWYGFAMSLKSIASITNLAFISFERYIVISKPFAAAKINFRVSAIGIAGIYLYSFAVTAPPLFGWNSYIQEAQISCSMDWLTRTPNNVSYIMYLFTFGLIIPLLIILISYIQVVTTIKTLARQQAGQISTAAKAEKQVAQMVVIMISLFLFAWSPYTVLALLVSFTGQDIPAPVAIIPAIIAKSSVVYNPIIYVAMNKQFRHAFIIWVFCGRNPFEEKEVRKSDKFSHATFHVTTAVSEKTEQKKSLPKILPSTQEEREPLAGPSKTIEEMTLDTSSPMVVVQTTVTDLPTEFIDKDTLK